MSEQEKKNYLNYIIVVIFIGGAYALGSLYTKVQMLEKGEIAAKKQEYNQPAVPPETGGLPVGKADIKIADDDPAIGPKNAKVVIVEFTDYQCSFCKSHAEQTISNIKKEFVDTGKVRLVVKDFPLSSIHPNAQKAAEAAHCAGEQKKYFEYHDQLFVTQNDWASLSDPKENFKDLAKKLGLNTNSFNKCLDEEKYAKQVNKNIEEGSKYGVTGTPATFVNGKLIPGAAPYTQFKMAIEEELTK